MNTKRILNWSIFIVVIGLIVWGMVAASNKAEKESAMLPTADKITSEDWSRGNASSSVSIVEYSDFQCPACAAFYPLVEELNAKMGNQFHFAYRHFPLTQHANAIPAAQASEAAGRQGKFYEMYSEIFINQQEWSTSTNAREHFDKYAEKIGLDMTKFAADYDLSEIKTKIDESLKGGIKAGVNSTPSFFLNGKKINPQSYEQFKKIIEEATATTTNP